MARVAGLKKEICQTIASAAQFVDDNDHNHNIEFKDGRRLNIVPTARSLYNIRNISLFEEEHKKVWLPFHFLPGDKGRTVSERLICRKDSKISQDMINHCLSEVDKPFGLYLFGIATHVYADTFAHYGFSGVGSRWNRVDGSSIIIKSHDRDTEAERRFEEKYGETMKGVRNWRQRALDEIKSEAAEDLTGALGHGGALKYPDFPYLKWEFNYEYSENDIRNSPRDNLKTFHEACEKLHNLFSKLEKYKDSSFNPIEFSKIKDVVKDILAFEETDRDKRSSLWQEYAENGNLFNSQEKILPYLGDLWERNLNELKDETIDIEDAKEEPEIKFLLASKIYRMYVIYDLLASYGLFLD
ncbi:MAG: hypothetical protein OXC62_10490 [Aestuariivita sp.]|nr:hypothetical protein [Aestuariivita sp.]